MTTKLQSCVTSAHSGSHQLILYLLLCVRISCGQRTRVCQCCLFVLSFEVIKQVSADSKVICFTLHGVPSTAGVLQSKELNEWSVTVICIANCEPTASHTRDFRPTLEISHLSTFAMLSTALKHPLSRPVVLITTPEYDVLS